MTSIWWQCCSNNNKTYLKQANEWNFGHYYIPNIMITPSLTNVKYHTRAWLVDQARNTVYENNSTSDSANAYPSESIWEFVWVGMFWWASETQNEQIFWGKYKMVLLHIAERTPDYHVDFVLPHQESTACVDIHSLNFDYISYVTWLCVNYIYIMSTCVILIMINVFLFERYCCQIFINTF